LSPKNYEISLVNLESGENINHEAYLVFTTTLDAQKLPDFEIMAKETEPYEEPKKSIKETEEMKLNAVMNALFAVSILNPNFDVSKVFLGDDKENKDPINIPKKAKELSKVDKPSWRHQNSFGKTVKAGKKGRINQPK